MTNFGRLAAVPLRDGWASEAQSFTPWLADNLDMLGEALGLALEFRQREHPVGRYSLDLLLSDAQGRVVIVENQLEQTDHGHLGQLLTYCAGTNADVVVWIASAITLEHAAALEWLNTNTRTGIGFFGVELQLLRIGDSLPAPHFNVVVRPNDWTKAALPTTAAAVDWAFERYVRDLRVPPDRVQVAERLVEAITAAVEERGLAWQPVMRKGYVGIQRPGGYNVLIVDCYWAHPPRVAVKLPAPPSELALPNPYPELADTWKPQEKEWGWTVPPGADLPDVGLLVDLARPYHPATGPMALPSS
jgi:hypothetical protein